MLLSHLCLCCRQPDTQESKHSYPQLVAKEIYHFLALYTAPRQDTQMHLNGTLFLLVSKQKFLSNI